MTDIGLLIHGLGERADHQALEQQAIGPRGQAFHQLAKFARRRLLGKLRAHLQRVQHLLQLGDALVLGLAVDPIQASRLGEAQRHRRLDVGGDHALLDQAVRIVARAPHRTPRSCRSPPMRALTSPPRKSSAPRASRASLSAPYTAYSVCSEVRTPPAPHRRRACPRVLQVAPCLIVGQPRVRADHRLVESSLARLAGLADAHVADERQALDARHQRTQMIGQMLRQHRNDAIRKIHRGGARARLDIQRAAVAHVVLTSAMATISRQPPPRSASAYTASSKSLASSPSMVTSGSVAQILAALHGPPPARPERNRFASLQHLGRKFLRQIVPQDGEARRQVRGPQVLQHFDDAALRRGLALADAW